MNTTTTLVNAGKSYEMAVLYTEDILTVTSPGGKVLAIDLNVADTMAILSNGERDLLNRILSTGSMDDEQTQSLTVAELHTLANIKAKCGDKVAIKSSPEPVQTTMAVLSGVQAVRQTTLPLDQVSKSARVIHDIEAGKVAHLPSANSVDALEGRIQGL